MSTVIKAGEAGRIIQHLSTVDLADHLAEARFVVDAANRRAAQIVADAEVQAERAIADGRRVGYEEGHAQAHREGTEAGRRAAREEAMERFGREQGNLVSAMQQAIKTIDAMKDDLRIAAEKDLLDFAVVLATKLTFAIGRLHRESVVEHLRQALRLIESKTDVTIRVHPDDVKAAESFAEGVLRQADASRVVHLVPDVGMAPGGCRVESGPTQVDATLETQAAEMAALLTGVEVSDG